MLAVLTKWQLTAPVGGSEGTQQLLHGNNSPGATDAEWHCVAAGSCILGKICSSSSDCGGQLCVDRTGCIDEQPSQEVARDVGDAGGATASASSPPPCADPEALCGAPPCADDPLCRRAIPEATSKQGNNSPGATDAEWHCCYMVAGSLTLGKVCSSSSECGGQLCVDRAHCIDEQQGGPPVIDEQEEPVVPVADTAAAPAAAPAAVPSEATSQQGNNSPGATDAEWHCVAAGSCILGKVCSSDSHCMDGQLCEPGLC